MDPSSVLRAIWHQRWYVLPALMITLVAVIYVLQFGPRNYESTISYALVNPDAPTELEIEDEPELEKLYSDNPYLRSSNPALITNVMFTRLSSQTTAKNLEDQGLSPEYTVGRGEFGDGFVLDITGVGTSPGESVATTAALGDFLVEELREVQTVAGADDMYLFTALLIDQSEEATEQFSSRLRAVIGVLIAGAILVFGVVSLGRWLEGIKPGGEISERRLQSSRHRTPERGDSDETKPKPRPRETAPSDGESRRAAKN